MLKNPITTLTFDCYGTLVDWEKGACTALRQLCPNLDPQTTDDVLVSAFLAADSRLIKGDWKPYETVLKSVAREVCAAFGQDLDTKGEEAFVASVASWPLFEETNLALANLSKRYKLAIISNINDRLIADTLSHISAPFEMVMTSDRARSYKPEVDIFNQALQELDQPAERIIHVAEGLCEAKPARDLGMGSIWVRRSGRSDDGSGAVPDATVSSLTELVQFLSK